MSTRTLRALRTASKALEAVLNAQVTPGPRVLYVVVPGRGVNRRTLTRRGQQFLAYIQKRGGKATAADLQRGLRVNRNVVSGAVFELRKKRIVKSETAAA